jgi:glyoxylase-like metal-dependent hydrolase (beta-lactamase superfamily II)
MRSWSPGPATSGRTRTPVMNRPRASFQVTEHLTGGRLGIGDVEVVALSDGVLRADGGAVFGRVPRSVWADLDAPDTEGMIPLALNCYLIQAQGVSIVVDTGLGVKRLEEETDLDRPCGSMVDALHRIGIAEDSVDIVINTHLHVDHAGGNTFHREGRVVPVFPRARYVIQRREWNVARRPHPLHADLYELDDIAPLLRDDRIWFADGILPVAPGVRCVPAPGHTAGHQVVLIESAGEAAALLGDVALVRWHLAPQTRMSALDLAPKAAYSTKVRVLEWVARRAGVVGMTHDPDFLRLSTSTGAGQ